MILSDFLSRQKNDDSNLHEIILISFNMHNILHERYCNIGKSERYLVQMWSGSKSSRVKLLEVYGVSITLLEFCLKNTYVFFQGKCYE